MIISTALLYYITTFISQCTCITIIVASLPNSVDFIKLSIGYCTNPGIFPIEGILFTILLGPHLTVSCSTSVL